MLAVHAPDALRRAVSTEDLGALTMVPGIGKKGAQRIVLEMKDRLGPPGDGGDVPPRAPRRAPSWRDQVQSGLVNLGWPARDADQAIAALEEEGVNSAADGWTAKPTGWFPRWRTRTSVPSRAHCGPSGSPSSPARPGCGSSCR